MGVGCQSADLTQAYRGADDYKAFVRDPRPTTPGDDYHVGVPDTLHITVLHDTQTIEHDITLGPDGLLMMPGLHTPIQAEGQSPESIATAVQLQWTPDNSSSKQVATPQVSAPENSPAANVAMDTSMAHDLPHGFSPSHDIHVTVRVKGYASQRVFVFGQVNSTGGQLFDGSNTLASVLAAAHPGPRADLRRVLVLRPSPEVQKRRRLVIDTRRVLTTGDATLDVRLNEGDIVFVPATTLGRVGLAVDQVFRKPRVNDTMLVRRPSPDIPNATMFAHAQPTLDANDQTVEQTPAQTPEASSAQWPAVQANTADLSGDLKSPASLSLTQEPSRVSDSLEPEESLMTIGVQTSFIPLGPPLPKPMAQVPDDDGVLFWAP